MLILPAAYLVCRPGLQRFLNHTLLPGSSEVQG